MSDLPVLKIDSEFESIIPPLDEEEFRQLTDNILRDGEIYTNDKTTAAHAAVVHKRLLF